MPETLSGMELLEHFKASATQLVFVVDEYGAVQGMITVIDVLEAITGEFTTPTAEDAWAVRRDDGSWLFDGLIPVPELKDRLELKDLPEEDRGRYNTLAGMVMLLLGRLPRTADSVEWEGFRFEVVDMDGKRVDKVMVSTLAPREAEGGERTREHSLGAVPCAGAARSGQPRGAAHRTLRDYSIAARMHAVFVAATEIPEAALEFPSSSCTRACSTPPARRWSRRWRCSAWRRARTCYVEGSRWQARYMPAFMRRYPFVSGRRGPMIDMAWAALADRRRAAVRRGRPAHADARSRARLPRPLRGRGAAHARLHRAAGRARPAAAAACRRHAARRQTLSVEGFLRVVDEERLRALPDAAVLELHRSGMLMLATCSAPRWPICRGWWR